MKKNEGRKKHYIDTALFTDIANRYCARVRTAREQRKEPPPVPDFLTHSVVRMIKGMAQRPNFKGYTYIDEMKPDALEDCVKCLSRGVFRADPKKGNGFRYFSRIIWQAFIRRLAKEEDQQIARYSLMKQHGLDLAGEEGVDSTALVREYTEYLDRNRRLERACERRGMSP